MWNSLSLTDSETSNLLEHSKFSTPANAIVGRLAMKKFVSLFEIEKGMKIVWDVIGIMETTRLGDNIFMFVFTEKKVCERIVENQP